MTQDITHQEVQDQVQKWTTRNVKGMEIILLEQSKRARLGQLSPELAEETRQPSKDACGKTKKKIVLNHCTMLAWNQKCANYS